MRALISVHDKRNLEHVARGLVELGAEIISTGGTYEALQGCGVPVRSVAEVTGFPEVLEGRVKTLHPAIHAGILADRSSPAHMQELGAQGVVPIDVVVVNLYPFVQTVSTTPVDLSTAVEQIDVGGVALIRAAAKNFRHVLVAVDPRDYDDVLEELRRRSGAGGAPGHEDFAQGLAAKAYAYTAAYDSYIASYLRPRDGSLFPEMLVLPARKVRDLRYGENPHQRAAFYTTVPTTEEIGLRTLATARQLQGRELSLNNLLDLDAAWTTVRDFRGPTCVIVKHTNPCGLASRATLVDAYEAAHSGDPVAAWDGTVAVNGTVDAETAEAISAVSHSAVPYQAVVAPEFAPEALEILERRPNLCLIAMGERSSPRKGEFTWLPDHRLDFKRVAGGFAAQHRNALRDEDITLRVVSKRQPTFAEITDLKFAWKAVKHVKSNAIVLAKHLTVVGVGAGQMKRIDAVDLAIRHAGDRTAGSVLASDAYFPFADGIERAVGAHVTAIIQPGGSIRDDEAIRAADSQGVAMVFTGTRQFKH